MRTFLKAQASSLISSVVDFLVTVTLKEVFGIYYLTASVIGVISGGVTNFLLGRNIVFSSTEKRVETQAFRYIVVWVGNLILNTLGVYLFTSLLNIEYRISKILVAIIVGLSYNYVLQKFFVFKK